MRLLLWGLAPDGSAVARFARGLLLALITGILPLLGTEGWPGREQLLKAGVVAVLGFLAGWLRAGEPNAKGE